MWLHLLYLCVTVVQYLADVCCCCFLRYKPMMLLNSCHDCRLTGGFVFWIIIFLRMSVNYLSDNLQPKRCQPPV